MKLTIVIVGWYFKKINIYKKLIKEVNEYTNLQAEYYISSHMEKCNINPNVVKYLNKLGWEILYFENEGWDWGAFQQFSKWQKRESSLSDYYLFLHDDIKIKNFGFINAFINKMECSKVVGNGYKKNPEISRKITYPHVINWAKEKGFPIKSDLWNCVRGSCFFTTKEVVENIIIKMPVKKGENIGLGNWSVIIFGGLVYDMFGQNAISYISKKPLKSNYINEDYRGETIKIKNLVKKAKNIFKN